MDAAELIREGEVLARPCVYLRDQGSAHAGFWTGDSGPGLVFDSRWIPAQAWPQQGVFSVRPTGEGGLTFSPGVSLPRDAVGLKLYATPALSLPPLDGLFLLGSERVQAWLRDFDWPSAAGYNDNFPDRAIAEEYERHYQQELPFYSGGAHAVLGGWHFPWPDSDWIELASCRLLAWTFAGSEPWLEAWAIGDRVWLQERIT